HRAPGGRGGERGDQDRLPGTHPLRRGRGLDARPHARPGRPGHRPSGAAAHPAPDVPVRHLRDPADAESPGALMPVQVELAVHDLAGIQLAAHLGPDRIELCTGLALGGLTPSAALVKAAVAEREHGGPRVHVLIRPRTGGFCYNTDEITLMRSDIARAVAQGVDGVVIGAARQDDDGGTRLDLEAIAELRSAAEPARAATGSAGGAAGSAGAAACSVRVALHRVIDTVSDPVAAVRELHG